MKGRNDIHHISAFRQECKNVWKEGQDLNLVLIIIIPEYGQQFNAHRERWEVAKYEQGLYYN